MRHRHRVGLLHVQALQPFIESSELVSVLLPLHFEIRRPFLDERLNTFSLDAFLSLLLRHVLSQFLDHCILAYPDYLISDIID